ncbi:MAG: dioxygenase [Alphaproteobacteria bacterium]|nr:dioxygenase [Alphaproteobacteria bacterium]
MRDLTEDNVTEAVLAKIDAGDNPRLKQIIESAITHMHAFARDVELTPDELFQAARFFTEVGKISDDKRHEFLLLSDTLGLTILVDAMQNRKPPGATESSVLGPFYRADAPEVGNGDLIDRGDTGGDPTVVHGSIKDLDGAPIKGALLDIWQATQQGLYENIDTTQPDMNLRGRLRTDANGEYVFRTVLPACYPIPDDGPAGQLLSLCKRHNMRPGHIHFIVSAEGFVPVTTEIFVEGDEYLDSDAVFGVKESLVAEFTKSDSAEEAAKWGMPTPFHAMRYDFVLEPGAGDARPGFSAGGD